MLPFFLLQAILRRCLDRYVTARPEAVIAHMVVVTAQAEAVTVHMHPFGPTTTAHEKVKKN